MNAHDRAMAKLAERYLDASLKLSPITASYVGYHKWDHLLPDMSPAGVERAIHTLEYFANELAKIDHTKTSTSWAIDHQLIASRIEEELFVLEELKPHEWDVNMYNQVVGGGFYYLTIPPEDPAKQPDRLKAVLGRMQALPEFLAQAKKNLKNPPRIFTEFVIAQNPGNLSTFNEQLPKLFAPHPELLAEFERLKPGAVKAIADYQSFLEKELLSRSTGDWRLGKERWEKKLAMALASDLKSDDIYREAERALEATRKEMLEVARYILIREGSIQSVKDQDDVNEVVGKVIAEASKEHGTPETFFADVQKTVEKAKAFITKSNLVSLPPATDNFVIEPTPAFLDGLAVAFYNPAPAFEPNLKKSYWISSVPKSGDDSESYLREYNLHTLQALTIHEAFPGHYVQLYWSSHSEYASITKQVLESGTMTEGWAVMIEHLLHEEGYSKGDPKAYLFHLKFKLRNFINAMIDAKLHTNTGDEATTDQWALDLMMSKGFQEKAEATRKLRRAKLTSTQLSTYFVGYREMLDIYRAGQAKGGASFEKQAFLHKMMSYGSIPPRIIRGLLRDEGLLGE